MRALRVVGITEGGGELSVVLEDPVRHERYTVPADEQLRAAAGTRKITLEGASDAIAAATLQSRIEELAASVGATIGSTESLPAEARSGFRRIGLRYVLSGPYETLVRFLAKLETATPPLVIDNLHIHGVLRRPGTPAAAGLDAGLDVYGYRNGEKAGAGKP